MPLKFENEDAGNLIVIKVTGKLAKADYVNFVPEFDQLVKINGKMRVLFDMTDFHGWEAGGLWEDNKFAIKHFADIELLAMVGDKKWEQGLATLCKPFTTAKIRYFDHHEIAFAREWLKEPLRVNE